MSLLSPKQLFITSPERTYKLSLYEAFFTSFTVGLGETYFIAYALHLGSTVVESGLLSSLPLIFAGISPFFFRRIFHRFVVSNWVLIACAIQCVALAALAVVGMLKVNLMSEPFYPLLFIYSLYWFGNFSALPSWNKWIHELIPHKRSDEYFSRRTRTIQWGILLGLVSGGLTLHFKLFNFSTTFLFIILFLISYHFKFISFYLFFKQPPSNSRYDLNFKKALAFLKQQKSFFSNYSLFNTALFLSAPFVSGYLLSVRGLDYLTYMWVMGALFIGKITTTMLLDKMKKKWSPHQMYFWGGLVAAPLPALWTFCESNFSLALLHFVSGMGWAAWDVGISLAIFKKVNPHEKIEAVTIYNMVGLPTQVLGTILGAYLLKYAYNNNYTLMFVIAGVVRLLFFLPMYTKRLGNADQANSEQKS
ncbi:MAG: MFS transporter [Bdellovibrionaceae bacterium]|nr:MFS transporter [Bdellovibrio sp.]